MKENSSTQKVCSFYVSNMHFATMILPFVNKQMEEETKIVTFFENDFTTNIELVLSRITLSEERKRELLNVNWKNTNNTKYLNIEKTLKSQISKQKKTIIIINGNEEYINIVNDYIEKYLEKNDKKMQSKNIKIINFYEVGSFNENIKEILDKHQKIFNTAGEHKIEEVFDGYRKKEVQIGTEGRNLLKVKSLKIIFENFRYYLFIHILNISEKY